ncbi:unnamed protein product [Acanthoscelides obtectus]|uniref:Uncharacterized protein n=1 Tax=Acanthoscelides obtectus TaxID=200917 RepID=A0A9P0JPY2_ACAOB|nr:unnamed protein product [Acanthoscelides obtectus]CAK1621168.1 hypothetical protein AOBTE_LOCUS805 [Acanthoscelides obtectus]
MLTNLFSVCKMTKQMSSMNAIMIPHPRNSSYTLAPPRRSNA